MTDPLHLRFGSMRWTVHPRWHGQLFGPRGLKLDDWQCAGQVKVVKQGPHRTVYRVILPAFERAEPEMIYIKHNRPWNLRAWLRELVRPAKARIEYQRAREVAARGIATFEPLAVGESIGLVPGESYLVTRGLQQTQQLNTFLETQLPAFEPRRQTRLRQVLARALADFVRRLHDQGIYHHDFHPGNLLIRLEPKDQPRLFLVDLHAIELGRPLTESARLTNLTVLNNWFAFHANRSDRLRFWRAYQGPRGNDQAVELERRSLRAQLSFWHGRDWRCRAPNRYFRRIRQGDFTGYAVSDLDAAVLQRLLADPDEPFRRPGTHLLKDSRSSSVAELELPVDGVPRRMIWKRFAVTAWSDPWLALFRPTPAWRSWTQGHGLLVRGLPTPRPWAVCERRRRGLPAECYLLTEKIEHAADLYHFVQSLEEQPVAERRTILQHLIVRLARLIHDLHRCGISHRDLKASNILVRPRCASASAPQFSSDLRLWLIDLVGMKRHRKLGRARKVQNLARLNASFLHNPTIHRTDRLRFLHIYLKCALKGRDGWKRWWRQIEAASLAKAEQNRRRGRVLA